MCILGIPTLPNEDFSRAVPASAVPTRRFCKSLNLHDEILGRATVRHASGGIVCRARQHLPGVYRLLTILWDRRLAAISAAGSGRMRIYGATGMSGSAPASLVRKSRPGTFALPQAEAEHAPTAATGPRSVAGIDALMALQGVEDPAERRRRSVNRGRMALDVLEELKLGVLEGKLDGAVLGRLKTVASGLKGSSGDRNLDVVLAEIELRVEVEMAKLGPHPTP
jgi:hypothetical protein